jgi:hypothetical protein
MSDNKNNKNILKSLIIPFLVGGTVISGVKYSSTHIKNPAVAAIIGGIPTGLLALYFVNNDKSLQYAYNYFFITLSLLTSVSIFFMLHTYTKIPKNQVLLISVMCWAILITIRYMFAGKHSK